MNHAPIRQHTHAFGQERKRPGEARTIIVIAVTGTMMAVEIIAGVAFGSMALLADGLHMASHAAALSINAFAYVYARRHAHDARYSFGTGKVNALGGFTGAVLLAVFALIMAWKSVERILDPVAITLDGAIVVAILGLLINGASVFILGHHHHEPRHPHGRNHDYNLHAAHLHVLADALTSLLAIFALLMAKYYGILWLDPLMGILGALLVSRWSFGLLRTTSFILLDRQAPQHLRDAIQRSIEQHDHNRVADLHVWSVGPHIYAAVISILAHAPRHPAHYKGMIPGGLGLVHVTIEVCPCSNGGDPEETAQHSAIEPM